MYRDFLAITIKNHEIRASLKDLFNFSKQEEKSYFFAILYFFLIYLKELYTILFNEMIADLQNSTLKERIECKMRM